MYTRTVNVLRFRSSLPFIRLTTYTTKGRRVASLAISAIVPTAPCRKGKWRALSDRPLDSLKCVFSGPRPQEIRRLIYPSTEAFAGGTSAEASMSPIESLIFLLGAAAQLAQLARVLKVPYPVFLVLGGLLIGFVPGLPTVEISPEVIFLVFLPPLLSSAAFFSSPQDLRRHLRPILLLAIGLVLLSMAAIALIGHV